MAEQPQAPRPQGRRRRTEPTPVQRALSLLTRREHSRKELARKLMARGVEPEETEAAISRLADAGWQDDRRFAESLLRGRAGAGYGPVRISAELATHGLDQTLIDAVLAAYEGDWLDNAKGVVVRRFGSVPASDHASRRRMAEFLYRRGFSGDQVRDAIRRDPDDAAIP